MSAEPPDERRGGRRLGWKEKVVIPVVVAVIGALAVAALTPVGDGLRELLFPTKATVSGRVLLGEQGAAGAELWLDDKRSGNADVEGDFLLDGVHKGSHTLEVRTVGAERRNFEFAVQRGMSEVKVGAIQLRPLVQLAYLVVMGATPHYMGDHYVVDYDLNLWIVTAPDFDAVNQIESVSYELPTPLPAATVRGSGSPPFCYRRRGEVDFGPFFRKVTATIKLRNGHRLGLVAQAPDASLQPPSCAVTGSNASASPTRTTRSTPTTRTQATQPTTDLVTVPDVVGQTAEAATSSLKAHGLSSRISIVSSVIAKGIVVAQSPFAGSSVAPSTFIRMDVSDGSGSGANTTLEVPDVVGMVRAEAASALRAAGFGIRTILVDVTDPAQAGVVLSQSPAGHLEAKRHTLVTIRVGRFAHS
jgi:hypothetical protein